MEITFTPHYEITETCRGRWDFMIIGGERRTVSAEVVQKYTEAVRRIGEEYFPLGLKVICGLEVGWDESIADQLAKDLPQFDLDFIIGSVHEIVGHDLLDPKGTPEFFRSRALQEWLPKYFAKAEEIAKSQLFDVLGHLDVYKKFGLAIYGDGLRSAYRSFVDSLFSTMNEHSLALEINTAGIRHGIGEYYPSFEILNEARRAGVLITALGSDAHNPDQLALDFETATQLVHELLPCNLEDGD